MQVSRCAADINEHSSSYCCAPDARSPCLHDGSFCAGQAERHALEACVLEMAGKSAALERWLADNEKKAVTGAPCLSRAIYHVSPASPALSSIPMPNLSLVTRHVLSRERPFLVLRSMAALNLLD